MAELARGKMSLKIPRLVDALEGRISEHHHFLIRMHPEHLGYLPQAIAQLHQRIDEKIKRYQHQIDLICSENTDKPDLNVEKLNKSGIKTRGK